MAKTMRTRKRVDESNPIEVIVLTNLLTIRSSHFVRQYSKDAEVQD